jgi:hypothetical protein
MSNKIGENAMQKMARLLKKFEAEHVEEGSAVSIKLVVDADGSGSLMYRNEESVFYDTAIYKFPNLEQLVDFLGAAPIRRLLMATASMRQ